MNRDIFRRGVRMTHMFGTLEEANDPLGVRTFDPRFPERVNQLSSPPLTVQGQGEYRPFRARNAVVKPTGAAASLEGPEPDYAAQIAVRIPFGTKRRVSKD